MTDSELQRVSAYNIAQDLTGHTTEHLVSLPNGHFVHKDVADPFSALQQAAGSAGFDLQLISSFRAFDRQLAIWNGKFCGARPVFDLYGAQLDMNTLSDWDKCKAIMLFSALPGTSRHHWGTDFDFYDHRSLPEDYSVQLVAQEYTEDGPFQGLTQWLIHHARNYGFSFPYKSFRGGVAAEPWHISYHTLANTFQKKLDHDTLWQILIEHDIEGKAALLQNIDFILENYIHNIHTIG
ncbi:M15 family metallopeptidase [Flocculibacter collagenilyticus]|uniref:M15 family metallopeptidase n=1 Tax=Flocculibacter collagenilyticus TaxID=2744479 RepID=UPI0018F3AB44|nr:M15 family metallopeptidase [Flocculibacter collagenilyticus]